MTDCNYKYDCPVIENREDCRHPNDCTKCWIHNDMLTLDQEQTVKKFIEDVKKVCMQAEHEYPHEMLESCRRVRTFLFHYETNLKIVDKSKTEEAN